MPSLYEHEFEELPLVGEHGLLVNVHAVIEYDVEHGELTWTVEHLRDGERIPVTDPIFKRVATAIRRHFSDEIEAILWERFHEREAV